jgi:steroid Delta-isomerase
MTTFLPGPAAALTGLAARARRGCDNLSEREGQAMGIQDAPARVAQHVTAFNAAVRSGDWSAFADRFAPGATMAFTGVPAGPFTGRAEIARAYARQPPADTMAVQSVSSAGPVDAVSFAWAAGGTGRMQLTWESGLITRLEVSFDD